jgi:hypothetical protein
MKITVLQKALAVGIIAVSSSCAMALPIFTFSESAGFQLDDVAIASYTGLVSGPLAPLAEGIPIYRSMNWYDTSPTKSTLTLTNPAAGGALAIDTWTTITTLSHSNKVIKANPLHGWGTAQDIFGRLIISDEGGVALDNTDAITLTLDETPNTAPCAIPNPTGSTTPCDDFFTFTAVGLADLNFAANDGSLWTASFRLANFVNSFFDGVNTVFTSEGNVSSLDVQVLLTERDIPEVPEPATLGILGLGLLGLATAKRSKKKA